METDTTVQAAALIRAVEDAYRPTAYRDDTPLPTVGSAAPVVQPGRPPMSQRATDASVVMLAAGAASVPIGASTALVLHVLGQVDPAVLAISGAAPVALLVALARVMTRARGVVEAAPATHHHHYAGPVQQDHSRVTTTTRGVIARTTNNGNGDARR
ncbi:hypothetical protein AOB60_43125 [Streptomyces noursei]|uniref:Uncharacterized protein n=1 Tax=Streptomyces noursei TaxID=1971 RepID=A0A2N8P463_STRNR|nr:hypothetical protein AOB60_43125 [Streptomyces noursei]